LVRKRNNIVDSDNRFTFNQSLQRISQIETPKSESFCEFLADVNEYSSHSSRRAKFGFGPINQNEAEFIKSCQVYRKDIEISPSKFSRENDSQIASPVKHSKIDEIKQAFKE